MRIGVICEGQTDFVAIKEFLGASLNKHGIDTTFIPIQPNPDNTSKGGWTHVFSWLKENPPQVRVQNYFGRGIFAGGSPKQCDALIIQMDSDIIDESGFISFLEGEDISVTSGTTPIERGNEIERLLKIFSNVAELTGIDHDRHVLAPAVESSETWCIAAFCRPTVDPETLKGKQLDIAFGAILARSESRPPNPWYGKPDKSVGRRQRYCKKHAGGNYLETHSYHYRQMLSKVISIRS